MNIALVSPYDFAWPGGVNGHISQIADQFLSMGNRVRIMAPCSRTSSRHLRKELVPLGRPIPLPAGGSIARISLSVWLLPRIRKILEREQFDIVHVHEPLTPSLPTSVVLVSRSTTIGTFHASKDNTVLYRMSQPVLKPIFKRLDGLIAVSPAAINYVGKHYPGNYRVIPNGVDIHHFAADVPPLAHLDDGRTNLLFVGRLEKRKGLKYLLVAFGQLRLQYPRTRLIVVGPGSLDAESRRILNEMDLHRDVVLTGEVSYEMLARYYRTAHIFCAPATGNESLGLVLLEAMAASRPIVASDIEGFRSVLTAGYDGLLVPPKDVEGLRSALEALVRDPALREEMGIRARKTVDRYNWDVVAGEVLQVYEKAASTKN